MRGMRFNNDEAGSWRFRLLEAIRQDVLRVREAGQIETLDHLPQVIVYLGFGDLAAGDTSVSLAGGVESQDEQPELIEAVRDEVIKIRGAGEELLVGAPATVRYLGSALVVGLRELDAQLIGQPSGELIAEGAWVQVTFADLSTATYVIEHDGKVRTAICSADLAYVDQYAQGHAVDPESIKEVLGDLEMVKGRPVDLDLALLNAAMTAQPNELELLDGG